MRKIKRQKKKRKKNQVLLPQRSLLCDCVAGDSTSALHFDLVELDSGIPSGLSPFQDSFLHILSKNIFSTHVNSSALHSREMILNLISHSRVLVSNGLLQHSLWIYHQHW